MSDYGEWNTPLEDEDSWCDESISALRKIRSDMAQTSLKFKPEHWECLDHYLYWAEGEYLPQLEKFGSKRLMSAAEMRKVLKQIEALEKSIDNHWSALCGWAEGAELHEQLVVSKQGVLEMLAAKSLGGVRKPEYALLIGDLVEHIKHANLPIKLSASKGSHFDLLVTSIFRHLFLEEADSYHKHIAKVLAER